MSIEIIVGATGAALTLLQIVQESKGRLIAPKKDDFLNYDSSYLLGVYSGEIPIAHNIPYSEIASLYPHIPSIQIIIKKEKYVYVSKNQEWNKVSSLGYSKLLGSRRVKDNENAIRLTDIKINQNSLKLTLQQATYHDQCRSNLILDYIENEEDAISLRTMLRGVYGNLLPKINDNRLANTIGIATLLFYKNEGKYIPYMVKRVKKVGVFPGGVHCTASGVAKWPTGNYSDNFDNYFIEHMYSELKEEVGLEKSDIDELVPMSICREFARGGKPQIFFVGITSLSKDNLIARRKQASKVIKETNLCPEIEQTKWYHSEIVLDANSLSSSIKKYKVTLEGIAALYYGIEYLKHHVEYNA